LRRPALIPFFQAWCIIHDVEITQVIQINLVNLMNNNNARFFLKMNFRSIHTSANICLKNAFRDTWPAKRELATHQLQYIKRIDGIILLEQERMKYFLHYQDLLEYLPRVWSTLDSEEWNDRRLILRKEYKYTTTIFLFK